MVDLVHWNGVVPVFKTRPFRWLPIKKPVNNFGDLIGPIVVNKILELNELSQKQAEDQSGMRLLSVGSILNFARNGDVVWGTGRLGNKPDEAHVFDDLDVRAVRGPNTREFLLDRGIECPEVYGDPALLLPVLFPEFQEWKKKPLYELTIVPHFHDYKYYRHLDDAISAQAPIMSIFERIVRSRRVVGSSLHSIIIAEAFGVPARLFQSKGEHIFKYEDYYFGTGRESFEMAKDYREAIEMGGEPSLNWDYKPLLESFPFDLWQGVSKLDGASQSTQADGRSADDSVYGV